MRSPNNRKMSANDQLYSTRKAAQFLGIHQDSVRKAINQNRIKATKYGGRDWLITKGELLAYQAEEVLGSD